MRSIALWLAMLAVVWAPAAEGERALYRWQAADGTVHYANVPTEADAQEVTPGAPINIVESVPAAPHRVNPLLERERRWQEQGRREADRAWAAEKARHDTQCARLREQLAAVERQRASGKAAERRRLRRRELEDRLFSLCR